MKEMGTENFMKKEFQMKGKKVSKKCLISKGINNGNSANKDKSQDMKGANKCES